jgi:hypothetical protein
MHIHRPKPLHGWRGVSLEIGIIVVGIVIAICLDQAVEFVHHQNQRHELEAALNRDGEANRAYVKEDIASAQAILEWALTETGAVESAGPAGPLILHRMPSGHIGDPDAGVWPSARASGVSSLLPSSAQNWLEYLSEQNNETWVSSASAGGQLELSYAALDEALIGHTRTTPSGNRDISSLNAAQRAVAAERLRSVAKNARGMLRRLLIYDAGNEFILTTPLDQLDTREAGRRYERIYKAEMDAHPAAKFAFGNR